MKERNPHMGDYRTVRFKSGRHKQFWKGNVVGIGNAYGFVEPLQSTAIHMAIEEVHTLIDNFSLSRDTPQMRKVVNRRINAQWDYLRWFLAVHYKFNRKIETDFWRECHSHVDVSGLEDMIALYKEGGLLTNRGSATRSAISDTLAKEDRTFGLQGLDAILLAQGVLPKTFVKTEFSQATYRRNLAAWHDLLHEALPQKDALEILGRRPDLFPDHQAGS